MRMDQSHGVTAAELLNHSAEKAIADWLHQLGEERRARKIAGAIVRARPIRSTLHLADVVERAVPRTGPMHPATRTFMALRMVVNREQEELDALLKAAPRMVKPGGRIVMISFMSLEDRKVKESFRELKRTGRASILTKKPIDAQRAGSPENPPSRSAKLRAVEIVRRPGTPVNRQVKRKNESHGHAGNIFPETATGADRRERDREKRGARPFARRRIPFLLRALPNDDIYFYSKKIDNSRIVRQADPEARGECWSAVGAAGVLLMLGASIIAPHVGAVLAGYKLEALKQERQTLIDQKRDLEVKEAGLLSPERLNNLARVRSLASPASDQVIHLDTRRRLRR